VTTALLKFMAEFVLNKTQRLTFDSSSPNGILLFREVSRVICTYGSRVVGAPPPGEPYGAVSWLPGWRSGLGLCV
jgi:exportin-7